MCQVCGQFQRTAKDCTFTMTVRRREILFADPKETERLIGRVLAGNEIREKFECKSPKVNLWSSINIRIF